MASFADEFSSLVARAKEQGYTQASLSEAAGINRVTVAQAKNRPEVVGFRTLVRLCDIVGYAGSERRALLYSWIQAKAGRVPEVAALIKTVDALRRKLPASDHDEIDQIVIDSWAAEEARQARDERRRRD